MENITVVQRGGKAVGTLEETGSADLSVVLPDGERAWVGRGDLEPLPDGTLLLKTPLERLSRGRRTQPMPVVTTGTVPVEDAGQQSAARPRARATDVVTIPRVEEQVHVDKVVREQGGVRVRVVPTEREESVAVPVTDMHAEVKRVEVGRMVDAAPPVREEGDTLIIPVIEEVLVIQKRLLLREEVHVIRRRETRTEEHRVALRSEHVEVTRDDPHDIEK